MADNPALIYADGNAPAEKQVTEYAKKKAVETAVELKARLLAR